MPVCKKGRVGRQTAEGEGGTEDAVVPFLLRTSPASSLPPSFSGLPFSPPVFSDVPSVHPSWILFHGVKWRRAHLGNVLSIDWNEDEEGRGGSNWNEDEEGRGGSSRSKSWSFEFPPFPLSALSLVSPIAISQTRFSPPPSLPPSAADRRESCLRWRRRRRNIFFAAQFFRPTDGLASFLPSRWRWSE